jgi:thioesterase domain-containing protein
MQATPATWRLLFESGWKGNRNLKVLVGGESLPAELARQLVACCGPVWNMYGPTETTIWSSVYRVRGDERLVPIGRPIANTTFYILDADRQPVPVGRDGQLYIGGDGLSRGYFKRPDLTAEKFVLNPFGSVGGTRMYATGDLARYREDGMVEFLGRIDHQVKIRGFRIELGEIESVLENYPGIATAVTVAREHGSGSQSLAAYVVPQAGVELSSLEIRAYLQKQLPEYMVPSAIVQLATLPLTPNGKVDRQALPSPGSGDFSTGNYVAARDLVEKKLVALWEEVLDIRPIGVTTNFFDLGGRSILAAKLFMRISNLFGQDLPLAALFEAPTIEALARQLRAKSSAIAYRTLVPIQPRGSNPPFFCVHGGTGNTLFLHRLARAMGPDQPFYGLEPEGLDGRRFYRKTVEEMAAHYIAELRHVQPQGPYSIGGYCFGGIVAFEMARQLRAMGEQPAVVAMFSAPLRFNRPKNKPHATAAPQAHPVNPKLRRLFLSPKSALRWRIVSLKRKFRLQANAILCRIFLRVGAKVPQSLRTMYVVRMISQAEQNYRPQPYAGSLVLFRGRGLYENDPNMGWDALAELLENHEIGEGETQSRRDIMNEPLVEVLAQQLANVLASMRNLDAPQT